jgi:hypothetical protein
MYDLYEMYHSGYFSQIILALIVLLRYTLMHDKRIFDEADDEAADKKHAA